MTNVVIKLQVFVCAVKWLSQKSLVAEVRTT